MHTRPMVPVRMKLCIRQIQVVFPSMKGSSFASLVRPTGMISAIDPLAPFVKLAPLEMHHAGNAPLPLPHLVVALTRFFSDNEVKYVELAQVGLHSILQKRFS